MGSTGRFTHGHQVRNIIIIFNKNYHVSGTAHAARIASRRSIASSTRLSVSLPSGNVDGVNHGSAASNAVADIDNTWYAGGAVSPGNASNSDVIDNGPSSVVDTNNNFNNARSYAFM